MSTASSCPPRASATPTSIRSGRVAAAEDLLDAEPELTALVALDDSMAVGTLAARRSCGVGVPDRVSVVGLDDMPADVTPALAMVRLPLVEMGPRDDPGPATTPRGQGPAHRAGGR
ncbi:substrate-binding domain-containing protein [Micromonospora sp. NPDC050495]|uniref:substrate-binding domain-containing protein n=1 Tax=Micromonospora sp. NPDC050495 TaxID=3154936 RepID=UPI0033D5FCF8